MTHIFRPIAPVALRRLSTGLKQCHAVNRASLQSARLAAEAATPVACGCSGSAPSGPQRATTSSWGCGCASSPPLQAGRPLAMPFFPHECQQQPPWPLSWAYESVQVYRYKMKYLRDCHQH
jgi:hypothetical protein